MPKETKLSKEAARTFISAVNSTKAKFAADTKEFYDDFIKNDDKRPTDKDLKALAKLIKEAEEDAEAYHDNVRQAMAMFGGPSDTAIRNAKIMYETIKKRVS